MSIEGPDNMVNTAIDLRRRLGGIETSYERVLILLQSKLLVIRFYELPVSVLNPADAVNDVTPHASSFCNNMFHMVARKWSNFSHFAEFSFTMVHLLWPKGMLIKHYASWSNFRMK